MDYSLSVLQLEGSVKLNCWILFIQCVPVSINRTFLLVFLKVSPGKTLLIFSVTSEITVAVGGTVRAL